MQFWKGDFWKLSNKTIKRRVFLYSEVIDSCVDHYENLESQFQLLDQLELLIALDYSLFCGGQYHKLHEKTQNAL